MTILLLSITALYTRLIPGIISLTGIIIYKPKCLIVILPSERASENQSYVTHILTHRVTLLFSQAVLVFRTTVPF